MGLLEQQGGAERAQASEAGNAAPAGHSHPDLRPASPRRAAPCRRPVDMDPQSWFLRLLLRAAFAGGGRDGRRGGGRVVSGDSGRSAAVLPGTAGWCTRPVWGAAPLLGLSSRHPLLVSMLPPEQQSLLTPGSCSVLVYRVPPRAPQTVPSETLPDLECDCVDGLCSGRDCTCGSWECVCNPRVQPSCATLVCLSTAEGETVLLRSSREPIRSIKCKTMWLSAFKGLR